MHMKKFQIVFPTEPLIAVNIIERIFSDDSINFMPAVPQVRLTKATGVLLKMEWTTLVDANRCLLSSSLWFELCTHSQGINLCKNRHRNAPFRYPIVLPLCCALQTFTPRIRFVGCFYKKLPRF